MRALPSLLLLALVACKDDAPPSDDSGEPVVIDEDGDGVAAEDDCDDGDAAVYPGAEELCDGVDRDCDGAVDEGTTLSAWTDGDADGYGDPANAVEVCALADGLVDNFADCNDADAAIFPGAEESCSGLDNDCDGLVDEGAALPWYVDADGDGFGDPDAVLQSCAQPSGTVDNGDDCDDGDASVSPAATADPCDTIDNDCDGLVDGPWGVPGGEHATLAAAVEAAPDGATVCVSPGTYAGPIDFGGKELVVRGIAGAEQTFIDGGGNGPVVAFVSGEGADAQLRGFTVTGGAAYEGAGVYMSGASPTLRDVIITGNRGENANSYVRGAGLYVYGGAPSLEDVLIHDNEAVSGDEVYGAGVYLYNSAPTLTDVTIANNRAEAYYVWSGGLYTALTELSAERLWVSGNTCVADSEVIGCGVGLNESSSGELDNLVSVGNVAEAGYTVYGNGLWLYNNTTPTITNATISNNDSTASQVYSSGITLYDAGSPRFVNVCITGNDASANNVYSGGFTTYSGSTPSLVYSNLRGNTDPQYSFADGSTPGSTVISVLPRFRDTSAADPLDWDLRLSNSSNMIDVGDPRIYDPDGSRSDIGAYGGPGATW
ncbi:MAG: right-handed parallel beta-helix repeat-containing protein [Alphaproteobacteria bacterium]|nr:right-handed parallel beta-helix repeat-containing protein [Alphaproteobacteria bacterium]